MKPTSLLVMAYGTLLILGGLIGYLKGSPISLIMGGLCGIALFIEVLVNLNRKTYGHNGALILSALLTLFFIYRLYETSKFMPAGLTALISAFVYVILLGYKVLSLGLVKKEIK